MDNIGAAAIRSLGVDIANLSARLAVQTAILEDILTQANEIEPKDWPVDGDNGDVHVILNTSECAKVQALLASIASVQ